MLWPSAASRGSRFAVGEDADVLAQLPALVEHVAAHMRQFAEHLPERGADGVAAGGERTVGHQFPQPAGEVEFGHAVEPNHPVVPAKAGTHTPRPVDKLRGMGPGPR